MSHNSVRPLVENEESRSTPDTDESLNMKQFETKDQNNTRSINGDAVNGGGTTNAYMVEKNSRNGSCTTVETCLTPSASTEKIASLGADADQLYGKPPMGYNEGHVSLYKALSPIIKCMEVFGIWHSEAICPEKRQMKKSALRKIFNSKNYSILVMILLWFNWLRFVPAFFVGSGLDPNILYFKVIYIAFLTQCALNQSVIFWTTSKPERIAAFFDHWEKNIQCNPVTAATVCWVRKRAMIFSVIGVIYVVLHTLNQSSSVFSPVEGIFNASQIFAAPFIPNPGIHLMIIIINIFNLAVWIYPIFLLIIFTMLLRRQFEELNDRIETSIDSASEKGIFPPNFGALRSQHNNLCIAVDKADKGMFTYLNVITYSTMVPLACFLFYNLIFSGGGTRGITAYLMYIVWIISIFINVCVVSWIAALMSSSCHDSTDKIYNCVTKDITNDQLMQATMFLSRLNGEPVGFTIYDLVILTKPFILTIGGLAITYYAVIAESSTGID